MRDNPIQFAVVREDPAVELRVLRRLERAPRRALLVASGGCTALTLRAVLPDLELVLVDPNPAQLALVERKLAALRDGPESALRARFNVGTDDPAGLSQCGNFESLFRGLRRFVEEHVAPAAEIATWFTTERDEPLRRAFASRYWPVAFELFFHGALLEAMFTSAATQHAAPGSYPSYFRDRIERGLLAADAPTNRFLHHVFLGSYRAAEDCLPPFLRRPPAPGRFELQESTLEDVPSFAEFDLVDLSNVMDWMADEPARRLAARVGAELPPGAAVLWRQLNNHRDRRPWFGAGVRFDDAFDDALTRAERSLFYDEVHCGTKHP